MMHMGAQKPLPTPGKPGKPCLIFARKGKLDLSLSGCIWMALEATEAKNRVSEGTTDLLGASGGATRALGRDHHGAL